MRLLLTLAFVGFLLAITSTQVSAKCKPYPSYVYQGQVKACRPATEDDFLNRPDPIDPAHVRKDLRQRRLSIVTVSVIRIVQVARCGWEGDCGPAVTPWDDVTPTDFHFQLDNTCSTLDHAVGDAIRLYAVRPCCDKLPVNSARCAVGLPILLKPPDWVVRIVDDD